jgi:PKD domain-containing protein
VLVLLALLGLSLSASLDLPAHVKATTPSPGCNLPYPTISCVYVNPLRTLTSPPPASFTVGVMLNLTSGQRINQFDVRLVYSDSSMVRAMSVDLSNNAFAGPSAIPALICIDGVIQNMTSCTPDDRLGTVHVVDTSLGGPIQGPNSFLLFNVKFKVLGSGSSFFSFDIARLFNPGSDLQNPKITYVQEISLGGVFANAGIAPFYNYWPVNPPVILLHGDSVFDASPSFDFNGNSIVNYVWSWNDGSPDNSTSSSFIHHRFPLSGNYSVQLTVMTQNGGRASVLQTVPVQPALGSLYLSVLDLSGTQIRGTALVQIFNNTGAPKPFGNKTTDFGGNAVFGGLVPGSYYLKFSGRNIESNNATENISPGVQTLDTIYLKVFVPSTPSYLGDILFGVSMAAGIGVFAGALFWKRRSDARQRQGKAPLRSGKRGRGIAKTHLSLACRDLYWVLCSNPFLYRN